MAVYIELTTDPFEETYSRLKSRNDPAVSRRGRAGLSNVRRPLRGMEVKEDTYACIKVIRSDGAEIPLTDSSDASGQSYAYSNFILQSVQEARMEKHQIIETFGDPYIYFFGEAPRFLDCSALLINSNDFNWQAEWWDNWERLLRGSKTLENGARTYLFYDDNVVEGYMLMANAATVSTEPFSIQLTWRMFVSSSRNVSMVGDPNFPVREDVQLPPEVDLTSADAFEQLVALNSSDEYRSSQQKSAADSVAREASNSFGSVRRLTDALRATSRSVAFPNSVQAYVDSVKAAYPEQLTPAMDTDMRPIRTLIGENVDEYTGPSSNVALSQTYDALPEVVDPLVRDQLEVEDLFYEAISWMACFGANINSYSALSGLGLGVRFGSYAGAGVGMGFGAGVGIGMGASNGLGYGGAATYTPTAAVNGGYGGQGLGYGMTSFRSGTYASGGALGANNFAGVSAGVSVGTRAGISTSNPYQGYPSPYGGPGYGQSGYGDYGGVGYGSCSGVYGDPGYLSPAKVTYAGVEDDRSDLERLIDNRIYGTKGYGTGFGGRGPGSNMAGVGVGASVKVGGSVSAFALTVAPGSLNTSGNARGPSGRSLAPINPYGVPCLDQGRYGGVNLLSLI